MQCKFISRTLQVHYEKYNQKFGSDGLHESLTWDEVAVEVDKFKEDFIFADIFETEVKEKSMMDWMTYLPIHKFEPRHFESSLGESSALGKAAMNIGKSSKDGEVKNIEVRQVENEINEERDTEVENGSEKS